MAILRIECDQRFLKPHSKIESALGKYGRLDATEIANLALGAEPVFVEVEDRAHAEKLAETLNQIIGVWATVDPQ